MESIRIEIVNKKVIKILKELEELNLITIQKDKPVKSTQQLLSRLRSKKKKPSLAEITHEVETVRRNRYAQSR